MTRDPSDEGRIIVTVRGIDPDLWQRIRIEATRRNTHQGEMVNLALAFWLKRNEGKPLTAPVRKSL